MIIYKKNLIGKMLSDNGIVELQSISDWKEHERKTKEVEKRLRIVEEERKALIDTLDKLRKDIYKYPDIAIKKHKYWAGEDMQSIAKIVLDEYHSWAFLISNKDEKDGRRFSSSLGVLYNYPIPITEEKYNEIYNSL